MDLTTQYLGLRLRSPLVASASPLSERIDNIKRLEDAGAGAVVLYSLFEEQLRADQAALDHHLTAHTYSYAEALTYFPEPAEFTFGPEDYLEHIRKAKEAVDIPIIASLNGTSVGGWTRYARHMAQAGADALELNLYALPIDFYRSSVEVEQDYLDVLRLVKAAVTIPVAVKLSPFFSNMAFMARRFDETGADGLVLFNRFYQPDLDLETLEVWPNVRLSTSQTLRLPLRWIGILYDRIQADLAGTGGVHEGRDALKLLMAGANVTMLASALLRHGIGHLSLIEQQMRHWMEEHEYESIEQLRGSLSQKHCADPAAFERAQYIRTLHSYHPVGGVR
jgi:dihydroorotate dehydrogenase (fumarate)